MRNCPDLRQDNNRQQPKQFTPRNNPIKDEMKVEFDKINFVQDEIEETSTKGTHLVCTFGLHICFCVW